MKAMEAESKELRPRMGRKLTAGRTLDGRFGSSRDVVTCVHGWPSEVPPGGRRNVLPAFSGTDAGWRAATAALPDPHGTLASAGVPFL
jgi:hypothetical protein